MTASSPPTSLPSDASPPTFLRAPFCMVSRLSPASSTRPVIRPGRLPVLDEAESAPDVDEADRPAEAARFTAAADAVADRLRDRAAHATGAASEVLAATATLAQDRAWLGAAEKHINGGTPAVRAVVTAVEQFVDLFTQLGGLMAERVTDLRDIRDRVIAELSGLPEPGVPVPAVPSILWPRTSRPPTPPAWIPTLVVALATTLGGPTSHTAIIARQLGIPCVVAVDGLDAVGAGTKVLVDGTRGTVTVSPDPAVAAEAVAAARREAELAARWAGPGRDRATGTPCRSSPTCRTAPPPAPPARPRPRASACSAPNCASSTATPSPASMSRPQIYGEVLEAFSGRKVVIRTLDAGSDKPLKFAGHPEEANPALGVRGIRIAAGKPRAAGAATRRHRRRGASAPATRRG